MNRWTSDTYRTNAAYVPTLDRIPIDKREPFMREVEDLLREEVCDSQGNWSAHYVRLRFLATANP